MSNDTYYSRYSRLRRQLERANATWNFALGCPIRQDGGSGLMACKRVIEDIERQIYQLQEEAELEEVA